MAIAVAVAAGAFALGLLVGRYLPRRRSSVELRGNGPVQPRGRGRHRAW